MSDRLLGIYHHLPHSVRSLLASLRGYNLRWQRYGPETERLVAETLDREQWTDQRWQRWNEARLARVLHRAATRVPYYREYWLGRRRHGDRAPWDVLENWPVLKKEPVRRHPLAFVADDCSPRRMFCERTSGTTGTPLSIYVRRETLRQWYALFEARVRRWHGVTARERWAILGGQLIVPFQRRNPPFWVFNAGLNQLYLSTHHLTARNAGDYAEALRRFAPTHIITYPSSAYLLAVATLDQRLEVPAVKVVFTNAEFLTDLQRQTISRAFACAVRNTYGMSEMVAAASECPAGSMHLWPEVGVVEVFDDTRDVPMETAGTGRLVHTGLLNVDMPLIRYEIGDRGRLAPPSQACGCGRGLPIMAALEGRSSDLILTHDGRRIFWLNPAFYGLPVHEAQLVQENLERLRVRIVPSPAYAERDGRIIAQRLRDRVGDMDIVIDVLDHIPRAANGKFRPIVSHIGETSSGDSPT